jgi:RNA 2',3'-cyclic 3'-phosphodiesterase
MVREPRRLFIALMPDKKVQGAIARHCREWTWPEGARATPFGHYHLTLHFLGDVGLAPEQRLRKALRKVTVEPLEIELCIAQVAFKSIAVLAPAPHDGLRSLHQRIAAVMPAAGLMPSPQEFKPHLTLARKAAGATPPAKVKPIAWRVSEFALVWSVLWPQAKPSRYEVVEQFETAADLREQGPAPSGQPGEQYPLA